jgi:hypothetical protein
MTNENATDTHHDQEIAPELAALNLPDKSDGPAAAAMLSAGIGIFMLGVFTTGAVITASLKDFLAWWEWGQGVGPLAGKSTVAVIIWLVSWAILYLIWRERTLISRRCSTSDWASASSAPSECSRRSSSCSTS